LNCVSDSLRPADAFPTRRSSDLIKKESSCALLSNKALVEPSAIAHPFISEAFAKFWLISVARPDPPVMELTKNGALSGLFKNARSEEHTSELQSRFDIVCRLLLE